MLDRRPTSACFASCEPAQRLESGQEEIRAAPQRGERRQPHHRPANRALRDLEIQSAILRADNRVALVTQLVEITVVHPNILCELELPDEAGADHERRDAAFLAVIGGALRK